jgi:hypothetical protein
MEDQRIKVSVQFRDDFELVTTWYEMPPEEVEDLRRMARADYATVREGLADTAGRIRRIKELENKAA